MLGQFSFWPTPAISGAGISTWRITALWLVPEPTLVGWLISVVDPKRSL